MDMNKKARTEFLRSDKWRAFRKMLLEERGNKCVLCGQKYYGRLKKNLHLHHLHPTEYDNLDPDRFAILCKPCHKFWHRILRRMTSRCPLSNPGLWELMRIAITPKTLSNIDDPLDLNPDPMEDLGED